MDLLFDLGSKPPTTRTIALQVRERGPESLDQAQRRADEASYQEVTCRSALNPVKGMPFSWTLNPYRGCTHGCHCCFARRYHVQFELDSPSWKRQYVAVGTATDVYQPIEGHYRLTRKSIEALANARTPAGVITKG